MTNTTNNILIAKSNIVDSIINFLIWILIGQGVLFLYLLENGKFSNYEIAAISLLAFFIICLVCSYFYLNVTEFYK